MVQDEIQEKNEKWKKKKGTRKTKKRNDVK